MEYLNRLRPPAVAGTFYPADPAVLKKAVQGMLSTPGPGQKKPKALVVPHAGLIYSGPTAAQGFSLLSPSFPYQRIFLLGPSHRLAFSGISQGSYERWSTPLGTIDQAPLLACDGTPLIQTWNAPHHREHCLEVELPFLQVLGIHCPLVPLVFGQVDPQEAWQILEREIGEEDLLIVSTDLSHYHPEKEARKKDLSLIDAVLNLDVARVLAGEACGALALATLVLGSQVRGWTPRLLSYTTSGEVSGDLSRVVGYAALGLWEDSHGR